METLRQRAAAQRKDRLRNPAGHWIDFCKRKREESYRKARAAYDEQVRRGVRPAGRKPLPPHIVKQILAATAEHMQAVPPWLQEMEDRAMAAAKKVKKGGREV